MKKSAVCLALLLIASTVTLAGTRLLIDQGVRVAGLWCFPLASSANDFVYLPFRARLATNEDGQPEFSFIRYAMAREAGVADNSSSSTEGGGILHFLVLYETPPEVVAAATVELQQRLGSDEVRLRGPVIFKGGRFTLVSSILTRDKSPKRQVLASGRAPVLEGNRMALSFDLRPQEASLLMESFKMSAPDISLVFDMTFDGLADAYDAELVVDWADVRKSQSFQAGGSAYFVSAEVGLFFDELTRNNAIRLRSSGSDEASEALLTHVYSKLLELMFRPIEVQTVPPDQRGDLVDALSAVVSPTGPLSSRNTTGFGAHVGYQFKHLKSEGRAVLDFDHRAAVDRHSYITFNIGDLYHRYGNDSRLFRQVNLDDPLYTQREVQVAVDGSLLPEFGEYVNSVSVTLRKLHTSGRRTVGELVFDQHSLDRGADEARLVYGYDDEDRIAWLEYEFRTSWSFTGGGEYTTEWTTSSLPQLNLFAPYERRQIQVVGDRAALLDKEVRAVVVELKYSFFGRERQHQIVIRPGRQEIEATIEITIPTEHFGYDYSVTWIVGGDKRVSIDGHDTTGVIFVDELPSELGTQSSRYGG